MTTTTTHVDGRGVCEHNHYLGHGAGYGKPCPSGVVHLPATLESIDEAARAGLERQRAEHERWLRRVKARVALREQGK